ncbi:MAG: rRNA adenine N-6-methyltransferase family protein [Candidatus Woesearchaeota archaeon]
MKEDSGQHFMADTELIKRIVKYAKIRKGETVLEIGAGKGALTKELAKKAKVVAVETDESFRDELKEIENAEFHFCDAIMFLKENRKFDRIVANIPYMISEPLLNALKNVEFKLAVLTVGSNFAQILIGEKEAKLSITMPLFFEIKKLEDVSKEAFTPMPRTDSAVIEIKLRKKIGKNEEALRDFLTQEDKLAKNALRETLTRHNKMTKREAKEMIEKMEMKLEKNLKLLSLEEIKKIKEILIA